MPHPDLLPARREIWVHMLLYPGHTLPTAAAPILVAGGLALREQALAPVALLLAFLAGWLIQLGGVLVDNYENLRRHPNDREHPQLVQALRCGALTLAGLMAAILGCYGVALLAGAYLVSTGGLPVLLIGLASIAASLLYSAGPRPVGSAGLADPLFFLFFGAVSVLGGYWVQALPAGFPWHAVLLGLPIGALTTGILVIDDIRDREFDVVKGKNTLAVRCGIGCSRAEFVALLVFAYCAPLGLWMGAGYGAPVLAPLASLPLALALARAVLRLERHADMVPLTPRMARLLLVYAVLLAFGAAQG